MSLDTDALNPAFRHKLLLTLLTKLAKSVVDIESDIFKLYRKLQPFIVNLYTVMSLELTHNGLAYLLT